ncbi:MAG: TM2 domain-containing protein [Cytophagales bacterium]|nr:TM2 domain-containing protein [Bernardetiaceae bacterium]MDW8211734.1 TM2 domain-containing protein [Cytophagales bacterium]
MTPFKLLTVAILACTLLTAAAPVSTYEQNNLLSTCVVEHYPDALTDSEVNHSSAVFFKKTKKHFAKPEKQQTANDKSWIVTVLLCFFLGGLGIHRFYLGYIWQGVVQLLTLGGLGIWLLVDFIRILLRKLKPKDGEYKD